LAQASTDKEEIIYAKIDFSVTKKMRSEWPFLEERRIKAENV
jgi:predicted amidohydrolase